LLKQTTGYLVTVDVVKGERSRRGNLDHTRNIATSPSKRPHATIIRRDSTTKRRL